MIRHRRIARKLAVIALAAGLASAAASSGAAARSARRAVKAPQAHAAWCKSYDTLPMMDMTKRQMMDEMMNYPQPKADLDAATCAQLVPDLVAARQYAQQFPTAAVAIAHGYRQIALYAPGQGAHYMGPQGFGTTIDPKVPNFLLFGGNSPSSPLVGIMWLIDSGNMAPQPGLPGGNDHWHRHGKVCFVNGMIVADDVTDATCAAMGGGQVNISNLWMLHVWILPGYEYRPDIFRPHVPFLM